MLDFVIPTSVLLTITVTLNVTITATLNVTVTVTVTMTVLIIADQYPVLKNSSNTSAAFQVVICVESL